MLLSAPYVKAEGFAEFGLVFLERVFVVTSVFGAKAHVQIGQSSS